jgi:hypothetical protein
MSLDDLPSFKFLAGVPKAVSPTTAPPTTVPPTTVPPTTGASVADTAVH